MNLVDLHKEVKYRTSRSSGAGGQHVNKVATKVELLFNVEKSAVLSGHQKEILKNKLGHRISLNGILSIQCDESRSQLRNKEIALSRFLTLIKEALRPIKKRKPTKPSRSAIQKRLKNKKIRSQKKDSRRFKPDKD